MANELVTLDGLKEFKDQILKFTLSGIRGIYGTKVVKCTGGNAVRFITLDKIVELLQIPSTDKDYNNHIAIFVSNGDADANAVHVEGASFRVKEREWWVVYNGNSNLNLRLNFVIVYFTKTTDIPSL